MMINSWLCIPKLRFPFSAWRDKAEQRRMKDTRSKIKIEVDIFGHFGDGEDGI